MGSRAPEAGLRATREACARPSAPHCAAQRPRHAPCGLVAGCLFDKLPSYLPAPPATSCCILALPRGPREAPGPTLRWPSAFRILRWGPAKLFGNFYYLYSIHECMTPMGGD